METRENTAGKIEVKLSAEVFWTCHFCGKKNLKQIDPEKEVEYVTCRHCKRDMFVFEDMGSNREETEFFKINLVKVFIHDWSCPRCGRSFADTSTGSKIEALVCNGPKCRERVYIFSKGNVWTEAEEEKVQSFLEKIRERLSPLQGGTVINKTTVILKEFRR